MDSASGAPTAPARFTFAAVRRAGIAAWSALGIVAIVVLAGWALWTIRVILLPVLAAAMISVGLSPLHRLSSRAGLPRGVGALAVLLVGIGALVAAGVVIVPSMVDQVREVGAALEEAGGRLERWVARERPFGMSSIDLERLRSRLSAEEALSAIGLSAADGIRAAGALVASVLLVIVTTFFLLKDGPRFRAELIERVRPDRARRVTAMIDGVVGALRAYLLGAVTLGTVEGAAIGVALWLTGSDLAIAVGFLTLIAAFVPFVGAIVVGVVAIGVALVSGGPDAAIIVAVVVIAVQQFDNELLAPVVYGRFLRLHPLAVILSTAVGIEVAGVVGAFATVPLVASGTAAWRALADTRPSPLQIAATDAATDAAGSIGDVHVRR